MDINNKNIKYIEYYDGNKFTNDYARVCVSDFGSQEWLESRRIYREIDDVNIKKIEYCGGTQCWYINGMLGREDDEPAMITTFFGFDWVKYWIKNGKYHRDGDKPAITTSSGVEYWFKNGVNYRENNKPIIEYNKTKNDCIEDIVWRM